MRSRAIAGGASPEGVCAELGLGTERATRSSECRCRDRSALSAMHLSGSTARRPFAPGLDIVPPMRKPFNCASTTRKSYDFS
jgi:hypothetical protein